RGARGSGFHDAGAGDEVVDAAAVLAEDEAGVDDREDEAEAEGQQAGEARHEVAQEPAVDEAGAGAVVDAHDAETEYDFRDGLAARAEEDDLNDRDDQHAGAEDEETEH